MVNEKLGQMDENYLISNVPFNFYYSSEMTQKILEKPLEKKAGKNYGPPGNKKLIYFLDDMNMPEVDKYGTVGPHTIIRQHMDYGHWSALISPSSSSSSSPAPLLPHQVLQDQADTEGHPQRAVLV